jgi:hypothetical protein
MSDIPAQPAVRRRRISTWGQPRPSRRPDFAPFFEKVLRATNRILAGIAVTLALTCVGLTVYLGYGVTFTNLYASDGTIFSCQIDIKRGN